jgi:hypothetical protein
MITWTWAKDHESRRVAVAARHNLPKRIGVEADGGAVRKEIDHPGGCSADVRIFRKDFDVSRQCAGRELVVGVQHLDQLSGGARRAQRSGDGLAAAASERAVRRVIAGP